MVVKLRVDQFTGGDMNFSVRRRFRPNASYVKQFYTSGELNLEALLEYKKSKLYKYSDEYFSAKEEAKEDNLDDTEYVLKEIEEKVKEKVKDDIKDTNEKTLLDRLRVYTQNAPPIDIKRGRPKKLVNSISLNI
jgi:protein subunit release factor B